MKAQKQRLYSDVNFLTSLQPARNHMNTESLDKAADYIENQFLIAGLPAERQTWEFSIRQYSNIIASYMPDNPKRLIVGAHYDVAGDQPGADDNASGIAGLLETVRLVAESQPKLNYGIDFVAYCLEEPPFFGTTTMGSFVHAKSLKEKNADVIGMICYEMIGCFSEVPGSQKFPEGLGNPGYPDTGNFIMVVGIDKYRDFNKKVHKLMRKNSGIDVEIINLPSGSGLAGMSDHMNYWRFGYKALMINDTADFRNKNYHKESDTIDTLDFSKMARVIDGAFNAVIHMT